MKWKAREIFFAMLLLIASLGLGEAVMRLAGIMPHQLKVPAIVSKPGQALLPHPYLGLGLNPGKFQVQINKHLNYQCTHLKDSTRTTGSHLSADKNIFLFGCSFTYGMGISDSLTFPYLLQQQFPHWKISNFGVPAYGNLQSLLQLQNQLQKGNRPDLVVLNYASLHDSRNKLSPAQQKYWSEAFLNDSTLYSQSENASRFPYISKVSKHQKVKIRYLPISKMQRRWTWSHYSSLIHLVEQVTDHIRDGFEDKHQISQKIILHIQTICASQKIPLLLTGITDDSTTDQMLFFCDEQQIPTLHFEVDLMDRKYNLLPYDSHPNAPAHRIYAKKLEGFLKGFRF